MKFWLILFIILSSLYDSVNVSMVENFEAQNKKNNLKIIETKTVCLVKSGGQVIDACIVEFWLALEGCMRGGPFRPSPRL